jgi:hypothetical protein
MALLFKSTIFVLLKILSFIVCFIKNFGLKCHPGSKKWVRVFLKNLPLKMHFPGNNMMSEEESKTFIEN